MKKTKVTLGSQISGPHLENLCCITRPVYFLLKAYARLKLPRLFV